jgi:hypothetical protein
MPLADVLMSILNKKGLSATMEVRQFFQATGREDATVSKQDYLQQWRHLNPDVFTLLNQEYLRNFYSGAEEADCWYGHVVLAVDGSRTEIPNSRENRQTYGGKREQVWESGSEERVQ